VTRTRRRRLILAVAVLVALAIIGVVLAAIGGGHGVARLF
jgi:hypothetical protein